MVSYWREEKFWFSGECNQRNKFVKCFEHHSCRCSAASVARWGLWNLLLFLHRKLSLFVKDSKFVWMEASRGEVPYMYDHQDIKIFTNLNCSRKIATKQTSPQQESEEDQNSKHFISKRWWSVLTMREAFAWTSYSLDSCSSRPSHSLTFGWGNDSRDVRCF